jgi:hypothetical protein
MYSVKGSLLHGATARQQYDLENRTLHQTLGSYIYYEDGCEDFRTSQRHRKLRLLTQNLAGCHRVKGADSYSWGIRFTMRDFSRLPRSFMANAKTMFHKMQGTRILEEVITGLPLHVKLPILDDTWQPLTLRISSEHSTVIILLVRTLNKERHVKRADKVLVGKP